MKQTSQKVSSVASRLLRIRGKDIRGLGKDDHTGYRSNKLAREIRLVAASALSQDERRGE